MMKRYRNKQFYFIAIFLLIVYFANAQSYHFIYIQSENRQQFSIKLDDKTYNSSSTGYLILSKLTPGNYSLEFGFPGGQMPNQIIECTVADNDKGYYLKSTGNSGWGLYDMQTQRAVVAENTVKKEDINNVAKKDKENFGEILARVVNDPSIIQNDETENSAKQNVNKLPEKNPAVTVAIKNEAAKPVVPKKPEVADNSQVETIEQISSKLVTGGLQLAYIDKYQGVSDTIDILVPESLKKEDRSDIVTQPVQDIKIKPADKTNSPAIVDIKVRDVEEPIALPVKKETKKTDSRFIDMELPNPNETTASRIKPEIITQPKEKVTESILAVDNQSSPVMINSDCRRTADEDDFIKLRQQMASERTDDDMITVARKKFKATCFSTEQVKNLAVLFLKDEGKYKFFDAAYPFTSDSHNFSSLKDQLSDPYYINRFKAMIRKQ